MHSTSSNNNQQRLGVALLVSSLVLVLLVFMGVASASRLNSPLDVPQAQATSAPQAVGTFDSPDAVATTGTASDNVVPNAVATAEAARTPSLGNNSSTGNTGDAAKPGTNAPSTVAGTNNNFPLLALLVVLVLLLLAALAFLLVRTRRTGTRTVAVSSGPSAASRMPATAAYNSGAGSAAATAPVMAASSSAAAAAQATVAAPRTLTCPNCSTVNDWAENFCHECGQDLRPVRSSIIAASAPPADIVTDDMPYLETLDRTDEQLEYVLSRKRVVIGTAPGNDIMIDSAFRGYETVAPKHAELRREGDGFMLVDLDSEHGTYVNNVRTGENLLTEGDQISFGTVKFIYRVP
ncbi:MAG: FHA domain-containing protein [Chloroflexota bacterium]